MTDLMKTRVVLPLASDLGSQPWFQATPDEEPDVRKGTRVSLGIDIWEDMGQPKQITVTIEPGDLLNAHDSSLGGEPGTAERAFNEAEGDRSE